MATTYTLIPGLVSREISESRPRVGLFPSFYTEKAISQTVGAVHNSPAVPTPTPLTESVHALSPFVIHMVEGDKAFSLFSLLFPLIPPAQAQILACSALGMHT